MVALFFLQFQTNIQVNTKHHVRQEKSKREKSLQGLCNIMCLQPRVSDSAPISAQEYDSKYSSQEMAVCSHHIANAMFYTALTERHDA